MIIDIPFGAQLKAQQEPILQHWQDNLAEHIESELTGAPLTLVLNILTTDPNRGSEALSRLDAVYGHHAARDDNTDQAELLQAAVVKLHRRMISAATNCGLANLVEALKDCFIASVSLGTTGALHDKQTMHIAKMIREQCPNT